MDKTNSLIGEYFSGYAASVAQSRALISVEDGLKPSLRQALYANYTDKYVGAKKKAKFLKLIGSASRFCWHGDSSTYGMMIRAAKPFAMRYPLYGAQGSFGTLMDADNHAAQRYVEGYISDLGATLFNHIDESTITDWRDNYDNTEQYPGLLPSTGFWNLCNGTMGIGVGLASSIPQFNLREMNNALIKIIEGGTPNIPMPDFATGATLLNATEVRESLLKGQGVSCKLRAKMIYDEKTRTFTVIEIPYATYTNTICKELEALVEDDANGIDTFIDVTGTNPNIQIKLTKFADPSMVMQILYAKTSLQNTYGINLTMLEDGRYPRVFGLLEAMKAHVNHEFTVYSRSFEYQLIQIQERLHLLAGYILACAHIEEIVDLIKNSKDRNDAKIRLTENFELSLIQADAVLKLTLSRIAALEVQKFITERTELEKEAERIQQILDSEYLLGQEVIKGLRAVITKHGDARRTELLNVEEELSDKLYYFTNDGKVSLTPPKTGSIITTLPAGASYLCVTHKGIVYRMTEQPKRQKQVFKLEEDDRILKVFIDDPNKFLTFIDEEKHFRCKEVSSLNKIKTTLPLSNLKEIYYTSERTTKSNYKEIISKQ